MESEVKGGCQAGHDGNAFGGDVSVTRSSRAVD